MSYGRYSANIYTYYYQYSIAPHSFIAGLNPSFLQILPTVAFLFFFGTDSTDSLDCLPILLSMPVFLFSFFFGFPLFSCRFRAVD